MYFSVQILSFLSILKFQVFLQAYYNSFCEKKISYSMSASVISRMGTAMTRSYQNQENIAYRSGERPMPLNIERACETCVETQSIFGVSTIQVEKTLDYLQTLLRAATRRSQSQSLPQIYKSIRPIMSWQSIHGIPSQPRAQKL